jgi:hypothetical protein
VDEPLREIGIVAARLFSRQPYLQVRLEDVADGVTMPRVGRGRRPAQPGRQGRSLMWLYGHIQSKGQVVALGATVAWQQRLATDSLPAAPEPVTLREAASAVSAAVVRPAEFIGQHRFLFEQLAHGLSDLPQRRNSVPRRWPDSPLGRVVAGARDGWCVIFADWLAPILQASSAPARFATEAGVWLAAKDLSDLVLRVVLRDRATSPLSIADGLAAYWYERYLLTPPGSPGAAALRELDDAERAARLFAADPSAARVAGAAQARAALATGRAHRRAATEYAAVAAAFTGAREWAHACDAASRLSLALQRWGDLRQAADWAATSRQLAAAHLGTDDQRVPRADTLAANAATAAGRPAEGLTHALAALTARTSLNARRASGSSWRQLSLSQESHAFALAVSGRLREAVAQAAELVADRERRLSGVDGVPAPLLDARRLLGYALLEQGRLGQARDILTQLIEDRRARGEDCHANTQRGVADLARCLLLLGQPGEARGLLEQAPGASAWFASRVSFRLACTLWRYQAEALLSQSTGHGDAAAGILDRCAECLDAHGAAELDPLRLAVCRVKARAWYLAGAHDDAIALLTDAVQRQHAGGDARHPRLLAARCELGGYLAARGDVPGLAAARREFGHVVSVPVTAVDAAHPCRLAAYLGLARVSRSGGEPTHDLLTRFTVRAGERLPLDFRHPVMRAARMLLAADQPGRHPQPDDDQGDWDE